MAKTASKTEYNQNPGSLALGLSLNMAWQLAAVVLLPIVGGYFLDQNFGSRPWFTVVGFALAMAGMLIVVSRTLEALNRTLTTDTTDEAAVTQSSSTASKSQSKSKRGAHAK